MRGKEGEKKREKGETTPYSGYIRGNIAYKNVRAPFSYSSRIASSFFSSSISFSFTYSSPPYSITPPPSTPSRLRRPSSHHAPPTYRRKGEKKKKESTPDREIAAREDGQWRRVTTRVEQGGQRRKRGKGDARRMRDGQSVRKERETGKAKEKWERIVCADGVSRHSRETEQATRQKRFGALLAASRRVEKPEAPGKTRFPN